MGILEKSKSFSLSNISQKIEQYLHTQSFQGMSVGKGGIFSSNVRVLKTYILLLLYSPYDNLIIIDALSRFNLGFPFQSSEKMSSLGDRIYKK